MKSICVIGLGYVGLPTALLLASRGYKVIGYDINTKLIDDLSMGYYFGNEPDVQKLLSQSISNANFSASNQISKADVYIVAVPTPIDEKTKTPKLDALNDAIDNICHVVEPGNLIIIESTSPVGTTEAVYNILSNKLLENNSNNKENINVAYCPERILPGSAIKELSSLGRVIGGFTERSATLAVEIYSNITNGKCIKTTAAVAEFVKLAENSYRDVNIAFANELQNLCENNSVDPKEVILLANAHPRVNILQHGIGVGGHCIPVDPWFLLHLSKNDYVNTSVIRAARQINDNQTFLSFKKIKEYCAKSRAKNIMLLGISYKPDSDDIRNSPAVEILNRLINETELGIKVCDPHLSKSVKLFEKYLIPFENLLTQDEIDLYFVLVNHSAFRDSVALLNQNKKTVVSLV